MFPGGSIAIYAMFLVQASAQIEAGMRIETRAGEAPTGIQQVTSGQTGQTVTTAAEQAQVMVVATPNLRLRWFADADDLQADSATRILWRPVPLLHTRPLFLETLWVTHTRRPTRRSSWRLDLQGTYGEQDYTFLSQQFANQPTLPSSTTMFMVHGTAEALWHSSRRTTLMLQLGALHRRALDGQTTSNEPLGTMVLTLPTQTTVEVIPALLFALTRRSGVQISVPVRDYNSQEIAQGTSQTGQLNVVSVQPQLSLLEEWTRHHRLKVIAGFTYVEAVWGPNTNLGYHFTPLTEVELNSHLYHARAFAVESSVDAGTSWFLDPVLGRGVWRGIVRGGLDAQMGFHWRAGAHLAFSTDITSPPMVDGTTPVDGTVLASDFSVRYRWPNLLVVEFGGRFSERAPKLSTPGFTWHARELWAFLTLYTATRMSLTSSRSFGNTMEM